MKHKRIEQFLVGILIVIAGGIIIHAPITVWLGTIWPSYDLVIKSWKELLMGVALVLLVIAARNRKMIGTLLADRLMQLCIVYAGLHFLLVGLFQNGLQMAGAGLLIDLRFVLYFALVYATLRMLPGYRKLFIYVFIAGATVVIGFGLLQLFVLPKDILSHIGYTKATIAPYLTVDENPAFIRINSTLRGPNPLGAFAVIAASLLLAVGARWKLRRKSWWVAGIAAVAIGMVLSASYSRSSLIAAVIAIMTIIVISSSKKMQKRLCISLASAAIIVGAIIFVFRDNSLVSNVILHDNPSTGAAVDSNAGHLSSLVDGSERLIKQPLGAGIGSTGSASLLGSQPIIIENQYLLIAHETGWFGLALFVWLFVTVMRRLWVRRQSALALGVFGSGVGLAFIGLLLPVWTDDTVSIVWWGLAAVAVASPVAIKKPRKNHGTRTSN